MQGSKTIRIAYVISIIGHGLFLGMPDLCIRPSEIKAIDEILVDIDIEKQQLLPKINNMGKEKKIKEVKENTEFEENKEQEEEAEKINELTKETVLKEKADPAVKEKIKVFNPADEEMLRYQDMVKQRIQEKRQYPSWAERNGIKGKVHVRFTIISGGFIGGIKIAGSSGFGILDNEAISIIKRAAPFPPIPENLCAECIQMNITIIFNPLALQP